MRYLIALLFLVGCDYSHSIDFNPVKDYVPTIGDQAAALSYVGNTVYVGGVVGQFKLEINNPTGEKLTDVHLIATVNDPSLVQDIFFSRIYHEIFWGGGVFVQPTDQFPSDMKAPFAGYYAVLDGDDLPSYTSVQFDSVVLGSSGLTLNLQVYGTINGQAAYGSEQDGINIVFNY